MHNIDDNFEFFTFSRDLNNVLKATYAVKEKEEYQQITVKHQPIKQCPCCCGVANLIAVNIYSTPGVIIKCNSCGLYAKQLTGVSLYGKKRERTFPEAVKIVCEIWNKRENKEIS